MDKITREDRIVPGVTGGKELELSPLSEGICQQSLVQIKPWPTHQNNRCWITCWRSHWSRSSPASKNCSKCRACRGADLQSGRRTSGTWHPQESLGNWAANICTLGLLFVADVIRDVQEKITICCRSATYDFFQVVRLRQSCWSYVAPSSVLSVYYDKICITPLVVLCNLHAKNPWILPMHSNVTSKNVSGFTLAEPPCIYTVVQKKRANFGGL